MLSTDQKGVIAETAITHAAVKAGIGVALPLAPQRYDLVFDVGGRLLRIQCKWATRVAEVVIVRGYSFRRTRNGFVQRAYTAAEIDAVAAYCREIDSCYLLPVGALGPSGTIQLRLAPARNNQKIGINWARDFEFGATLATLAGP